jgi:hypothetical protein
MSAGPPSPGLMSAGPPSPGINVRRTPSPGINVRRTTISGINKVLRCLGWMCLSDRRKEKLAILVYDYETGQQPYMVSPDEKKM